MSDTDKLPAEPVKGGEVEASAPGKPGRRRGRPPQRPVGPGFGPPGLVGSGEKAKDFRGSFRRLVRRLQPEYRKIAIVIFLAAVSVALMIAGPKILAQATDLIFEGYISSQLPEGATKEQVIAGLRAQGNDQMADMLSGMDITPGEGVDMAAVGEIVLFVGAIYVLSALFAWLQGYLMAGVVQRIVYRMRSDVSDKLARLPLKYFDDHARGDTLSRVTNDIDNIQQTLQQTLGQIITAILTIIGVVVMMFWISPLLAVISLLTIPVSVVVTMLIAKRSQKQFALQWESTGTLNGHVEEMFSGHNIVKVFGRQKEAIAAFEEQNDQLYQASFKAQFISGIIMPSMMFIGNLNYGQRRQRSAVGCRFVGKGLRTPGRSGGIGRRDRTGRPQRGRGPDNSAGCVLPLSARHPAHRGPRLGGGARSDRRHRRSDRGGQDHARQPAHALL
jgi:ATP-binding cassette subfamily B multidrug efflux pump